MQQYLIASHGKLASGIQSSVKILTGMDDELAIIDAYLDDSDYTPAIQAFIDQLQGKAGIIFTDIIGGSVNQKVLVTVADHPNIFVVSGVNLPIVLSILLANVPITKAAIQQLITESQVTLIETQAAQKNDDEQTFFD